MDERMSSARYPEVLALSVYWLRPKFRAQPSVTGEEGPALDTALEGLQSAETQKVQSVLVRRTDSAHRRRRDEQSKHKR